MSFEQMGFSGKESPDNYRADAVDQQNKIDVNSQQADWNEIIVPDDELRRIEANLHEFGVESAHRILTERETLNESETVWRPGEVILRLTHRVTGKDLDHQETLNVVNQLRAGTEQNTIRLARIS